MKAVVQTLRRLSVDEPLNPYPSLFLGATDLSPLDVTRLYINFASGGFQVPLRSIREVLDADGVPLQRYELSVERVIDPAPAYLINRALQMVVTEGTAHALNTRFAAALGLAGKTGTTNELRDSWFAGYDGEKLGVIWMGGSSADTTSAGASTGAFFFGSGCVRKSCASSMGLEIRVGVHPPRNRPTAVSAAKIVVLLRVMAFCCL